MPQRSSLPDALPDWLPAPAAHADAPVLVGYSGGMDSHVLLRALVGRQGHAGVRAVHVDHGLHADSAAWARHCAQVCAALGVALEIRRVHVDRDGPLGLEGTARAVRRAAFADCLRPGEVLALAQHRDDQAETVLLRALRASGTDGLAAMRPWRRFATGWMWRPLLATPRDALRAFAREQTLHWVDDPSNADTDRDRNFLRHRVLPLLRERWPQAEAALARAAALSAESADLLQADDAELLTRAMTADGEGLSVAALRALPAARRARLLRRWVASSGQTPPDGDPQPCLGVEGSADADRTGHDLSAAPPLPASGLAWVESALLGDDHDTHARFAWAGWRIRRWREGLYLLRDGDDADGLPDPGNADHAAAGTTDARGTLFWDGAAPLALPGGGRLYLDGAPCFDQPLQLRPRRGGERIRLPGRPHHHRLKHVLQAQAIPPWTRARLPLLFASDGELWAAGDRILADRLVTWLDARGARLRWVRD